MGISKLDVTLCLLSDPPSRSTRDLRIGSSVGVVAVKSSARERLLVGVFDGVEVDGARRDNRDMGLGGWVWI